jgi:hypothetical protein
VWNEKKAYDCCKASSLTNRRNQMLRETHSWDAHKIGFLRAWSFEEHEKALC